MKKVIFTELEDKVLKSLVSNLYAEAHFSDVSPNDISKDSMIPMKSLRGVLASLVRKRVIFIDNREHDVMDSNESLIYLEEAFFYLHPVWKK